MTRTFASLRPQPRKPAPDDLLVQSCAHKIFSTLEGEIFMQWARLQAEAVLGPDATDGALRMHEGERQFVRKIEGLIASGKERSAGRQGDNGG